MTTGSAPTGKCMKVKVHVCNIVILYFDTIYTLIVIVVAPRSEIPQNLKLFAIFAFWGVDYGRCPVCLFWHGGTHVCWIHTKVFDSNIFILWFLRRKELLKEKNCMGSVNQVVAHFFLLLPFVAYLVYNYFKKGLKVPCSSLYQCLANGIFLWWNNNRIYSWPQSVTNICQMNILICKYFTNSIYANIYSVQI